MRTCLLIFALMMTLLPHTSASEVDAAYTAWSQGRPSDALPALYTHATTTDHWGDWLDLGLAAAAANQPGHAAAWFLEAHQRAPDAEEPIAAIRALGNEFPLGWSQHLGPLAVAGTGWWTPVLLGLAAACFTLAWTVQRGRKRLLLIASALLLITAPGWIAAWHDHSQSHVAIVQSTHVVDSTGALIADGALPAGSVLTREPREPWNGRILVRTGDGLRGWIPLSVTQASP